MTHSGALIEWESGGLDDIPTLLLIDLWNELEAEITKRHEIWDTPDEDAPNEY